MYTKSQLSALALAMFVSGAAAQAQDGFWSSWGQPSQELLDSTEQYLKDVNAEATPENVAAFVDRHYLPFATIVADGVPIQGHEALLEYWQDDMESCRLVSLEPMRTRQNAQASIEEEEGTFETVCNATCYIGTYTTFSPMKGNTSTQGVNDTRMLIDSWTTEEGNGEDCQDQ